MPHISRLLMVNADLSVEDNSVLELVKQAEKFQKGQHLDCFKAFCKYFPSSSSVRSGFAGSVYLMKHR